MAKQEKFEEVEKKEIRLPWEANQTEERSNDQILGWESGGGVSKSKAMLKLQSDKSLRQEMKSLKNTIGRDVATISIEDAEVDTRLPGEAPKGQKREKDFSTLYTAGSAADHLIPANFQAWYGTMPHLDAKQAYKQYVRDEERSTKIRKVEERQNAEKNKDLESMDLEALSLELEKAQKDFADEDAICKTNKAKIETAEVLDKDEEKRSKVVSRKLQAASYKHGIIEGKIRSSETYFSFIYDDSEREYVLKKTILTRTANLMQGEIAALKTEVRELLKQAREQAIEQKMAEKAAEKKKVSED